MDGFRAVLHTAVLHTCPDRVVWLVHVCVQYGDCLWKEAVSKSVCPGFTGPVAPARGQQVKQRMCKPCCAFLCRHSTTCWCIWSPCLAGSKITHVLNGFSYKFEEILNMGQGTYNYILVMFWNPEGFDLWSSEDPKPRSKGNGLIQKFLWSNNVLLPIYYYIQSMLKYYSSLLDRGVRSLSVHWWNYLVFCLLVFYL